MIYYIFIFNMYLQFNMCLLVLFNSSILINYVIIFIYLFYVKVLMLQLDQEIVVYLGLLSEPINIANILFSERCILNFILFLFGKVDKI